MGGEGMVESGLWWTGVFFFFGMDGVVEGECRE